MNHFLNDTVRDLKPSGIRDFYNRATSMQDALLLIVGEPDFVTPKKIIDAGIASLEKGFTSYSPSSGFVALKEEIANYLQKRFDIHYQPRGEIMVTIGGSEAIDMSLRAILNPGDEVLLPEPCYVAHKGCTILAGGIPVSIPLQEAFEFKLQPEQILEKITPKTKALILSYPSNPTGAIMTREDLEKIVAVLKDKDILVISDEIYAELSFEADHTHVSIASFPEMKDKTIFISGFSKAFAMTGWRLGYACAHKDFIRAMTKIHEFAIMSAAAPSQFAGIEALRNGLDEVVKMKDSYDTRRKFVLQKLRDMGLSCFEPKGAFYIFPNITVTGLSSEVFANRLLEEKKVAVIAGTTFGDYGEGFVRISYAYAMDTLTEGLRRIAEFVAENRK